MDILKIRVRGIFTVVLREDEGGTKSARILFPNGAFPQFANGNMEQRIMGYFPYVAVPLIRRDGMTTLPNATLDGERYQPNFICPINVDDHPDAPPSFPLIGGLLREMVHSRERIRSGLSDTDGDLYAIYFAPHHKIELKGIASWPPSGMTWDDHDIDFSSLQPGMPLPYPKSMKWALDLEKLKKFDSQFNADPFPPIPDSSGVAAFMDLEAGEIVPFLPDPDPINGYLHRWRLMHSALKPRPLPDGVDLTLPVDPDPSFPDAPAFVLTDRATGEKEPLIIPVDPRNGIIFIGNEPIDDLLRVAPIPSCSDPNYPFEIVYQLCDDDLSTLPVPVCANEEDDDRDPPETRCSPTTVVRRPGQGSMPASSSAPTGRALAQSGPKGFALHLCINDYARDGVAFTAPYDLRSAIFDAQGLANLTTSRGFRDLSKGAVLTDADVKNRNIMELIAEARGQLNAGDYFVLSFNGRGFNKNGVRGWVLFRKLITFTDLFLELSRFNDDVRVLVVSAACYSGNQAELANQPSARELPISLLEPLVNVRQSGLADRDDDFNLISVDDFHANASRFGEVVFHRPVIAHLAACGARQTIPDGANETTHSNFIRRCLDIAQDRWSFTEFERRLRDVSPPNQRPEVTKQPDPGFPAGFEAAGPFRIE